MGSVPAPVLTYYIRNPENVSKIARSPRGLFYVTQCCTYCTLFYIYLRCCGATEKCRLISRRRYNIFGISITAIINIFRCLIKLAFIAVAEAWRPCDTPYVKSPLENFESFPGKFRRFGPSSDIKIASIMLAFLSFDKFLVNEDRFEG